MEIMSPDPSFTLYFFYDFLHRITWIIFPRPFSGEVAKPGRLFELKQAKKAVQKDIRIFDPDFNPRIFVKKIRNVFLQELQ